MSDEKQRCTTCGGLGAVVERYQATDPKNGETFLAWRDKPCTTCGGKGWI